MSGRFLVLLCCLLAGGALYGCGGSNDSDGSADEKRLQQEEIARAERKARLDERQRQATRELKREVARLKRANRRKRSATPATGSAPASPTQPSGTRACGGGVFVGPNTSCPFAQNVRDAYAGSGGGNVTVTAYSPATNRNFAMYCSGGSPHVCSGGNNASVYFP